MTGARQAGQLPFVWEARAPRSLAKASTVSNAAGVAQLALDYTTFGMAYVERRKALSGAARPCRAPRTV